MGESAQYGAVENLSPPSDSLSNQSENIECSLDFASPIDSIYYFESPNGRLVNLEGPTAQVGTRVIFECTDSKAKTAFRECLADGQWSSQNNAIICDKWRYWAAVIAAATSAFIIIILLMYFTCSAYNKRKKRKYIARKESNASCNLYTLNNSLRKTFYWKTYNVRIYTRIILYIISWKIFLRKQAGFFRFKSIW